MNKLFKLIVVTLSLTGAAMLSGGLWYACKSPVQSAGKTGPIVPDTTSSNFTFVLDTIGAQGAINDISVLSDSDAYAVGQVYLLDSNGQIDGIHIYNFFHWNGTTWNTMRLFYTYNGDSLYSPIYAIYAFNDSCIWVANAQPYYWNGHIWKSEWGNLNGIFSGYVNRIWGTNSNDIYFGETSGYLVHWDGNNFTVIPTGINYPIMDIYGDMNPATGQEEIIATASNAEDVPQEEQFFQIAGTSINLFSLKPLDNQTIGIWFKSNEKYYVDGAGIAVKTSMSDKVPWYTFPLDSITNEACGGICGQDTNDIFIVGGSTLCHYNGIRWTNFSNLAISLWGAIFHKIRLINNSVFTGGINGQEAVVLHGKRY